MSTRYFPTLDRRLAILLVAQALSGALIPVMLLVNGFLGPKIAPTLELSTLPMSLVVIGVALASRPASVVMSKFGRKQGHLIGLMTSFAGVLLATFALSHSIFWLYCLACGVVGAGNGFNNQIRFTAAEGAGTEKALVHSWILMFGLFAAFLGPWITQVGQHLLNWGDYTGSLAIVLGCILLLMILISFLPSGVVGAEESRSSATGISRVPVWQESRFWFSALTGIAASATMTLLMSATPLQMHEIEHFSTADTTRTIQSHIIAMFLPSLFSGALLTWLGIRKLITMGVVLFGACIVIATQSAHFHHYWWALVLLGVGWNFLFLAGSTSISQSYSGPNRFAAQGFNDTLVFGSQALSSLAAGWLLFGVGWRTLVLIPIPLLVAVLALTWRGVRATERSGVRERA